MWILAVDDEPSTLAVIEKTLTNQGLEVRSAPGAQEALERIRKDGLPHLAVIDLLMPGMTGIELCAALKSFSDVPIVILTAVGAKDTVIDAIERFAEDYIVKPFDPRELAARIVRVLRRIGDFSYASEPLVKIDERLSVDFAGQKAIVDGTTAKLTPTESKLLYLLMRSAPRPVATNFLLQRLWPGEEVFEDTLRVHVHRLRQKIETESREHRYVVTERGAGYAFRHSA
jgi:DNA-binding response OmpR family regulator